MAIDYTHPGRAPRDPVPPLNPNRQGVQYTRFRPKAAPGGLLPPPGPIAPTPQATGFPQPPATPTAATPHPMAAALSGATPSLSALHGIAMQSVTAHLGPQFGSGY